MLTCDIALYTGHLGSAYVYLINALVIIFTEVLTDKTILVLNVFKGLSH